MKPVPQEITQFLFIRHGTTPAVGKALTGWLPGFHLDDNGKRQAEGLVQRLDGVPIDAIYSSPLERAVETATPLSLARNLPIQTDPDFREVHFGSWQGSTLEHIAEKSPELWGNFNRLRSLTRAPDGELMLETQARMVRGVLRLASEHSGHRIALFSHADAIKSAILYILGVQLDLHERLEILPTSISVVEIGAAGARVRAVNLLQTLEY